MELAQRFDLVMAQKDEQAKKGLHQIDTDQLIDFLSLKLQSLTTLDELESVDILAHFAGLQLVDAKNNSPIDNLEPLVIKTEDLGTYNRCGSRQVKSTINDEQVTYLNVTTDTTVTINLRQADHYLKIIKL